MCWSSKKSHLIFFSSLQWTQKKHPYTSIQKRQKTSTTKNVHHLFRDIVPLQALEKRDMRLPGIEIGHSATELQSLGFFCFHRWKIMTLHEQKIRLMRRRDCFLVVVLSLAGLGFQIRPVSDRKQFWTNMDSPWGVMIGFWLLLSYTQNKPLFFAFEWQTRKQERPTRWARIWNDVHNRL